MCRPIIFRLADLYYREHLVHSMFDYGGQLTTLTTRILSAENQFQITIFQLGGGIWTGVDIIRAGRFSRLQAEHLRPPIVRFS